MSETKRLLIEFLRVLADQSRLDILQIVQHKKCSSSEIQEVLDKSQSTISQHLKSLSNLNLITYDRINNINYYRVSNMEIFKLLASIKSFVTNISKDKFTDIRDEAVKDTLL